MLMSSSSRPSRLHYGPNGFLLRYWSVPLQEPYASAEIATKRLLGAT
jgi:hypothetical protein